MSKEAGAGRRGGPRRRSAPPDLLALAELRGTVTALEPQQHDPQRRSVYINGVFVVGLHEETILLAKLKVGQRVEGQALVAALRQDFAKRAWDDALTMLSASAKSRREVERRLARKYEPDVVTAVVERLVGGGWLDDAEFARSYVRSHLNYGERRLLADLSRRGVAAAVARPVLAELLGAVDETAQAREAAAVRLKRMPGVDRETAQRRLSGYLARRGYGFETISKALAPLLADLPRAERRAGGGGGLGRSSLGRRRGPEPGEEDE